VCSLLNQIEFYRYIYLVLLVIIIRIYIVSHAHEGSCYFRGCMWMEERAGRTVGQQEQAPIQQSMSGAALPRVHRHDGPT